MLLIISAVRGGLRRASYVRTGSTDSRSLLRPSCNGPAGTLGGVSRRTGRRDRFPGRCTRDGCFFAAQTRACGATGSTPWSRGAFEACTVLRPIRRPHVHWFRGFVLRAAEAVRSRLH